MPTVKRDSKIALGEAPVESIRTLPEEVEVADADEEALLLLPLAQALPAMIMCLFLQPPVWIQTLAESRGYPTTVPEKPATYPAIAEFKALFWVVVNVLLLLWLLVF
ncbi:MAG: hypothetical protein SGARI_001192 [Bacillariaceae sp.]